MKLKPKNWTDFQHYNKRTPPWIKLHRGLLDDFEYQRLPVASKALAPMLWLIASEHENGEFDGSMEFLAFRLRWDVKDMEAGLKPLIDKGFFVVSSGVLAERYQDATPEGEVETEAKREAETEPSSDKPDDISPKASESARIVFDYWRDVHDHPRSKLDDKRRKLIKARLADGYSVEDLFTAINGCKRSDFHQGDNKEGKVYDGLDLICRDGAHVDQFIKIAEDNSNPAGMGKAGRATARAAAEWLGDGTNG